MQDAFERIYKYVKFLDIDWGHDKYEEYFSLRASGHIYTIDEHLRSLIVSLLSANRPWGQIEDNLDNLEEIFHGYSAGYLESVDSEELVGQVCLIGCGNRRIRKQMAEIKENINTLRRIEKDYGTVDYFAQVAMSNIEEAVLNISYSDSYYKLLGIGDALSFQYLKQLGVDCVKPDVHLLRILPRLGYLPEGCNSWEVYYKCAELAEEYGLYMADVGAILWIYCAIDYVNICGATPNCMTCPVQCISSLGESPEVAELQDLILCYNYVMLDKVSDEDTLYKEAGSDDIKVVAKYIRDKLGVTERWY